MAPAEASNFLFGLGRRFIFLNEGYFSVTLEQTRVAIARLRADAEQLADALYSHAKNEADPVRHGMLFRLAGVLRDFVNASK
jgi:hypothetical protein